MWDTIVIGVNACGNHVRDKRNCHKRFDDIRSKLKKKIQHQRVHATGTGGGPTPQRLILSPLEELLRAKLLPVVVEGLPGDRDIGIYPSQFPPVAPEGHVSPETEQVSSPGSASSTHLEEHDEEDFDDDDDDDDDAAAAAIDTQIQASDHEEVPIETVLPPKRPANTTYTGDTLYSSSASPTNSELEVSRHETWSLNSEVQKWKEDYEDALRVIQTAETKNRNLKDVSYCIWMIRPVKK
ncbi:uncharacterized protein LOC142488279 [Ascaphus truei]|uniref:uncharacterized protein LOC142488279 n=1 Tax=Ascaphus truei TaxID=8439 RepID=UPI003F590370